MFWFNIRRSKIRRGMKQDLLLLCDVVDKGWLVSGGPSAASNSPLRACWSGGEKPVHVTWNAHW